MAADEIIDKLDDLISETRIRLQKQPAQAQEILRDFYDEAYHDGYSRAVVTVGKWVTAEEVEELYQSQR